MPQFLKAKREDRDFTENEVRTLEILLGGTAYVGPDNSNKSLIFANSPYCDVKGPMGEVHIDQIQDSVSWSVNKAIFVERVSL
jgi:hypothetical protein